MVRPALIAFDPLGMAVLAQPVWGDGGQNIERVAHCLGDEFEPIESTDSGEDMCGIGSLSAVSFEQAMLTTGC